MLEGRVIGISVWDSSQQAEQLKHQRSWGKSSTMTKVTLRIFIDLFFPKVLAFLKLVSSSPVTISSYIEQVIPALPVGTPEYSGNPTFVIVNLADPPFKPCMIPNFSDKQVSQYLAVLALTEELASEHLYISLPDKAYALFQTSEGGAAPISSQITEPTVFFFPKAHTLLQSLHPLTNM
jgi:hypothetical protein